LKERKLESKFNFAVLTNRYTKLSKISDETLKKYLLQLTKTVEGTITQSLPEYFGIILDGWSEGSTHYVAIFACYSEDSTAKYPLLAIAPLFDETDYGAESHKAFIGDVLELFGKSLQNLSFIVADNAAVNRSLSDLLNVPFVGCASHRFNLAVNRYLETYEPVIEKVHQLMTKLRTIKQAGKLRRKTNLQPVIRNKTRWSSTFEMVKRFFTLEDFIDMDDVQLSELFPSRSDLIRLKTVLFLLLFNIKALKDLEQFESVTKILQKVDITLAEVREVFDAILLEFPTMSRHLASDGAIVHSPQFESAVVKCLNGTVPLTEEDTTLLEKFASREEIPIQADGEQLSIAEKALQARKRRKLEHRQAARFQDLSFIQPTSNIVERLFSKARLILTDYRKSMSPYTFECLIFLGNNRDLWDMSTVANVIKELKDQ
jgi:hypothetical protein